MALFVFTHQFTFKKLQIWRLFVHAATEGSDQTECLQIGVVDLSMVTSLLQVLYLKNVYGFLLISWGSSRISLVSHIILLLTLFDLLRLFVILAHFDLIHQIFLSLSMHIQIVHKFVNQALVRFPIQFDSSHFNGILILFLMVLRDQSLLLVLSRVFVQFLLNFQWFELLEFALINWFHVVGKKEDAQIGVLIDGARIIGHLLNYNVEKVRKHYFRHKIVRYEKSAGNVLYL